MVPIVKAPLLSRLIFVNLVTSGKTFNSPIHRYICLLIQVTCIRCTRDLASC